MLSGRPRGLTVQLSSCVGESTTGTRGKNSAPMLSLLSTSPTSVVRSESRSMLHREALRPASAWVASSGKSIEPERSITNVTSARRRISGNLPGTHAS